MPEYIGKHRPTEPAAVAIAIATGMARDSIVRIVGSYDYTPRHSMCTSQAEFKPGTATCELRAGHDGMHPWPPRRRRTQPLHALPLGVPVMSLPTWRELAPSTPADHAAVMAHFRALVRDREAHPPCNGKGRAA